MIGANTVHLESLARMKIESGLDTITPTNIIAMMWVSVKLLSKICNPLTNPPWPESSIEPISFEEIKNYINSGAVAKPIEYDYQYSYETKKDHINRIAWYVVNGWGDSYITIDFIYDKSWPIYDGHHRICAAMYRGDEMIWADVFGSKEQIKSLYEDQEEKDTTKPISIADAVGSQSQSNERQETKAPEPTELAKRRS